MRKRSCPGPGSPGGPASCLNVPSIQAGSPRRRGPGLFLPPGEPHTLSTQLSHHLGAALQVPSCLPTPYSRAGRWPGTREDRPSFLCLVSGAQRSCWFGETKDGVGTSHLVEIQKPGQGHSRSHAAGDWGVPGALALARSLTLGPNCGVLYRWPMVLIPMLGDGKQ